ncbi:hypothetical protein [Chryseobacterium lathyri]|uniref:YcxB-like protein domain-containing protein n=1 Tax=Chryseobacterium lathyri TaxID=395933 RepID=A0ABT9SME7_9FLAO|nr:hypothetical protein [Chryseobacterium lathyri]MDP9960605.1 hypothetical protein [Chryseobacterium lathyri]MDQ0065896.1 hypothetical protein [Chryseobacterium lathyri]
MNTIDRYRFTDNGSEISFMPNYSFLHTLKWWLGAGFLAIPVLYYFRNTLSEKAITIVASIWVVYMGYFLLDLFFRVPVKYIFDKREKNIYRKLFLTKKIMSFDEMTYFINDESGAYSYVIGKKRNQFVRNYRISNYFSGSKASRVKEEEFLENILYPVLDVLDIPINRPQ